MRVPTPHLVASLLAAACTSIASAQVAFPGAEGFGAAAKGARASASPTVYRVTNLNDSGTGSLRDAVSASGRIVVFDVGGIIRINAPIVFSSNLTILGQTAPGGGITVYGNRVSFSGANNTICRYMRFRMGIDGDDGADCMGLANGNDLIFDHVSASWGRDETFSISGDAAVRITIQDCLIAQGLRIHSAGGLMQTSGGVSIFRTLYADNWMRNPKIKGVNDYINNVVYNWGGGGGYIPAGDSAGDSFANVINCYFVGGPETGVGRSPFTSGNTNYRLFHSGNLQDLDLDGTLDGTAVTNSSFPTLQLVGTRFAYPAPTTELSANAALAWVLDRAGASHKRDRTDDYVINEVRSWGTTGVFIYDEADMGGIGTVASALKATDTDNDGMPDWWEAAAGTNVSVADATTVGAGGYLNIERYAHSLVVGGVPGAFITGITTDTGASSSDGVTTDRTLVLNGTATPGASVALARIDTGALATVIANGSGLWTYDYTATSLADRAYGFTATATVSGVATPPSPAYFVTVDNAAPPAAIITGVALAPAEAISGTAQPFSSIVVSLGGITVGTATANELGNWTAGYTGGKLGSALQSFTAVATDLAGNAGPVSAAYVVNTGLAAPEFLAITTDTGASTSDRITNDTTLVFTGNAPASSSVSVSRAGVGVVGTVTATAVGAFTFDYTTTALAGGVHTFTATATSAGSSSPVSIPFVVTVDTTAPAISSIRRLNPSTYSTNGGTVVYRVTFTEAVSGVGLTDFTLTKSGTAGTLGSIATVSGSVYDVTATGVSGDGTVRLDLNSSGTGILDVANNAISGGYTSGSSYTVRLAGSGVWINTDDDGLWSDTVNWDGGLLASGSGATVDFSLRDITTDTSLILDSSRTLGRVVFGETDYSTPAGWTVSDGGVSSRVLTLASGSTPTIQVGGLVTAAGDTTDVPAANAYPHHLAVNLTGTAGFTKTGVGTLELNRPNLGLSGPLTITQGIVQVGPGGEFRPASVTIATSQQLRINGGVFSTPGTVSWTSGTGTGVVVSAGTASFQNITTTNTRNSFFKVTGGTVTAGDINFPRSGDSEAQTSGTGVLISGGDTTFANIGLGTSNSWAGMTVSGGKVTVTNTLTNGYQTSAGRGGVIYLSGGELITTGLNGLVMSRKNGSNADNVAKLLITGGTARLSKLMLGYDSTVTAGSATVSVNPGGLYIGSGGIVKNGTSGLASSITLTSGTLGAVDNWNTSHPLNLAAANSSFVIQAATPEGVAKDITLNGALTGIGGFTKTGGGTLTLTGAHTVGRSVYINEGTLHLTGSLTTASSGQGINANDGGTLAGTGTTNLLVGVFAGGTLSPGGAATANWTLPSMRLMGGSRIRFDLGTTSDLITTTGVSYGGGTGGTTITFDFVPGALTTGTPYTLISGPVSISVPTLAYTGLGYATGTFTVNANSLQFTITDNGAGLAPVYDWFLARGLPANPASGELDPDGDGTPALVEFVFGGNTTGSDAPAVAPGTADVSGTLYPTIQYTRRRDLGRVAVSVETAGADMAFTGATGVEVSATNRGDGFDTVVARSTTPLSTAPVQFFRVKAVVP